MKIKTLLAIILLFNFRVFNLLSQEINTKARNSHNEDVFSLEKDKQKSEEMKEKDYWFDPNDVPIKPIIERLKNKNETERKKAIEILGRIKSKDQIPVLEKTLLQDPSDIVRSESAKALRFLDSYSSIKVLKEALNDESREVQMQSAITLAHLGEKNDSFNKLKEIHTSGNRREKLACNTALRDIANDQAIEFIKKAQRDNNPYVAVNASIILAQLEHDEEAFPILQKFLEHPNNSIKRAAMRGLAYIGDEKSLLLIQSMLNHPDNLTKRRAQILLEAFN